MEKKKLAFVDLAIHQVTKSSDFLIELFKKEFDVVPVWYDYGPGEKEAIKEIEKYDNIFLLQIMLPYTAIIKLQLKGKNIVWAPMYDGLPMSYYYWEKIASTKIKILSFCGGIDNVCRKHNIDHLSVRFYKKPHPAFDPLQKKKFVLFFWYRGSVKIKDWIHLFPPELIDKVLYYSAPLGANFKNEVITEEEIVRYKIEKIELREFSKDRNIFLENLAQADIFICPRKQDGIGNPLIEAVSLGKFIVGKNDYTMKDYINHNHNGFLYDVNTNEKISLEHIKLSYPHRLAAAIDGYKRWEEYKKQVEDIYSYFKFSNLRGITLKIAVIAIYEVCKKYLKKILGKK